MGGLRHKEHVEKFLEVLARTGIVRQAAREVGMSHTNAYHWRARIPGFGARWDAAMAEGQKTIGAPAKATLYELGVVGIVETIRDKRGNIVWDPVDAEGNVVPPDSDKKVGVKKATRRVYSVKALEIVLKATLPNEFGESFKVNASVTHTHDVTEDVKKILADRESVDLANTLARRLALNAGGHGESAN